MSFAVILTLSVHKKSAGGHYVTSVIIMMMLVCNFHVIAHGAGDIKVIQVA